MTWDTYLGSVRQTVIIITLLSAGRGAHPLTLILQLANKVEGGVWLGQGEGSPGLFVVVHLEKFPIGGASGESRLVLRETHSWNSYFDFEKNQVYFQFPVHDIGSLQFKWRCVCALACLKTNWGGDLVTGSGVIWPEIESSARRAEPGETPGPGIIRKYRESLSRGNATRNRRHTESTRVSWHESVSGVMCLLLLIWCHAAHNVGVYPGSNEMCTM